MLTICTGRERQMGLFYSKTQCFSTESLMNVNVDVEKLLLNWFKSFFGALKWFHFGSLNV